MIEARQALRELFDQHESLRAMMDHCEQLADDIDRGRGDLGAVVREVSRLRVVFEAHNRFEEQVLRPLLRDLDAFEGVRIDHMFADHVEEHRALTGGLDAPLAELRATLDRLRVHLAAEERYFLSARVLRADAGPSRAPAERR